MPALKTFKIKIVYKIYTWRFNVGKPSFTLKKFNNFFKTLGTAVAVNTLIFLKLLLIKTISVYFINVVITKFFLPKPFKKYINIFLIKKVKRFFVYKSYNYTIDLNGNKPFYKLLYNLLITELT
jgi:hypothetical protein